MKIYQIKVLSDEFYDKYPSEKFPEIEKKRNRPYVSLLVEIDGNKFAIPFRTELNHKYGYKFKNSDRESKNGTGLDFTKAVIITDEIYLGRDANISNKEYVELNSKIYFIISKFKKYVDGYYKFVDGGLDEFRSKAYKLTTLKYFNKELKIKR